MLSISASNGGGFVGLEELAEALGMFQLKMTDYPAIFNGKVQEIEENKAWLYTYKGRIWRVQLIYGPTPHSRVPVPIRMHFDYIRQEGMISPKVYKDSNGNQSADFCEAGTKIALGQETPSILLKGCPTRACACGSDESPLTPATPEETREFWEAMGDIARE